MPRLPVSGTRASDTPLRAWQTQALQRMADWTEGTFLLSAAPGAGKTRPALELARSQLAAGAVKTVIVACPTAPLTRQWARAASALGVELAPDCDSPRPPKGFHGVAVTYARIAKAPRRWAPALPPSSLVVADEAHHLGEELAWGEGFATALGACSRWLLLSGTPFRSDAAAIPGVRYDAAGLAQPDHFYTYADAVRDRVCRPVSFVAYDGTLSWRSGDDVIESSFETVLSAREAGRRYRTAISTDLPDGLPRILREADDKLAAVRAAGHRDAGGLVIAADSAHARRIAALLRECTGRAPLVVLHAEPRAAEKLVAFTRSRDPWIVAVNMVSEGVDIPRLRVGVYATAAKTPLVFRQIVGRFVRTLPGRPIEPSWLYVPADRVLREHASGIEQELRHVLARADAGNELGLDEPERVARTERSEEPAFVPLSADVAPQLSLFGPPPGVAMAAGPAPLPTLTPPSDDTADERPAFERRAILRSERHRLVSEVTRRDRTDHREVNAWLNRRVGVSSVESATLEQLERSVELLVGRLTRRR
ncbi:MAG: DEAD/DEAH box helicase [Solirubrobacteraceae bacterium]